MKYKKGQHFTLIADGIRDRMLVALVRQSKTTGSCTVRVITPRGAYKQDDTINVAPCDLRHEETRDRPIVGEDYFPQFEADYTENMQLLKIEDIEERELDGGGFTIWADDGTGYDCFWSKKLQLWVYHVGA